MWFMVVFAFVQVDTESCSSSSSSSCSSSSDEEDDEEQNDEQSIETETQSSGTFEVCAD